MDDKTMQLGTLGDVEVSSPANSEGKGNTTRDDEEMAYYGKRQQLKVIPTRDM